MNYTTLISCDELFPHLGETDYVIVDCAFDLGDFDWGFGYYQRAHIPGAVYAHLNNDLASPITPSSGRHPLPDSQKFIETLSNWGITKGRQVVVYDTANGSMAVRLWWLLRAYGHKTVALLDGGFYKWLAKDYPTVSGISVNKPAKFTGQFDPSKIALVDEVDRIRQDPAWKLIDARTSDRYLGEDEPIDPIAGRIPGAVNRYHGKNLAQDGTHLPKEILRNQFETLLDGVPPEKTVVYCGSGVTSLMHLLAMEHIGMPGARLYVGSWSEWIRDPERPRSSGQPE